MTHPRLLDAVEQIIGPEILFHPQSNIRAKLPNHEEGLVPWHQDGSGFPDEAKHTMMVNFWIPIVDVTMDMGGMQVREGRHHHALVPAASGFGLTDDELPEGKILDCPLPLGGVLMIQKRTIHRSLPNTSDKVRWSLDFRYSDPRKPSGRPGGILVRSQEHPEKAICSYEQFAAGNLNRQAREIEQARILAEQSSSS